jgi:signal peptidase I
MEPTFGDSQVCIMRRVTSLSDNWVPDRYDIVLAWSDDNGESSYIAKRVIGLPGETVQLVDNRIYINGHYMPDVFGNDDIIDYNSGTPEYIPKDSIWIIGDNRSYTFYGTVKLKSVVGKIVWY